jgi:hypothetical protein
MHPALNGPLFAAGVAGLLAAGRRAAEDDLALASVVWLVPLAGLFGWFAGIAYPYYRFFNTTLGWVLLVGVGAYFLLRLFADVAGRGGAGRLALIGVAGVLVVFATNLLSGFELAKWNDPSKGWLSADARADLDALRSGLAGIDSPVVFVIDDTTSSFQIWGFTKLAGNTSRYGLPAGYIDNGYLYLGSLENFLRGRPTRRGEPTYDELSRALLRDTQTAVAESRAAPVVVVASAFNSTGANADIAARRKPAPDPGAAARALWVVHDGEVTEGGSVVGNRPGERDRGSGALHLVRVLALLALMAVPGWLAWRWLLPGGTFAEALGMVPALSIALLALAGIGVLAVARAPLSGALAAVVLAVALAIDAAFLAGAAGAQARRARLFG